MESIRELRDKVAKSSVAHYAPRHDIIVRKISIYFTWLLLHTPLSANGVTLLQISVGVLGSCLLALPEYGYSFAGIAALQLGYVLDCCDGEVARYKSQSSVRGVFLDLIGHEIVIPFMYMGLAIGEFQRSGRIEVIILGFIASLFSLRFDISAMFQVVNTMFLKSGNTSYNFQRLHRLPASETARLATTKPSWFRVLFRYPESMNLISIVLLADWAWRGEIPSHWSLIFLLLLIYGILIPVARLISIYHIFQSGEIEARYAEIVKTVNGFQTPEKVS